MTLYHAEQFIHIVASECETTLELRLVADFTISRQYRAANDDPGQTIQSRPGEVALRLYGDNIEIEMQRVVSDAFLNNKDFLDWLAEEALEIEQEKHA
jgi:hypothetical protein